MGELFFFPPSQRVIVSVRVDWRRPIGVGRQDTSQDSFIFDEALLSSSGEFVDVADDEVPEYLPDFETEGWLDCLLTSLGFALTWIVWHVSPSAFFNFIFFCPCHGI